MSLTGCVEVGNGCGGPREDVKSARQQLGSLLTRTGYRDLSSHLRQLPSTACLLRMAGTQPTPETATWGPRRFVFILLLLGCALVLVPASFIQSSRNSSAAVAQCSVDMPDWMQRAVRPAEDCSLCRGINEVPRITALSPDHFEQRYAYSGGPVIVTDAMQNWSAPEVFSFDFFKKVYESSLHPGCQFFPYQTEFRELREVFDMNQTRANMKGQPWYVGWSNCDERVARLLRQHYSRPYFLPDNAETKHLDWIFMGSPGYGAHMHVDNVGHSSWQAQLRGYKLWQLQPPPECIYECNALEVTIAPGEIIILDTNRWYHRTLIVKNELSITIGAEYD